jgi:hypothetical protein
VLSKFDAWHDALLLLEQGLGLREPRLGVACASRAPSWLVELGKWFLAITVTQRQTGDKNGENDNDCTRLLLSNRDVSSKT